MKKKTTTDNPAQVEVWRWGQAESFAIDGPKDRSTCNRVFAVLLCDGRLGLLEVSESHPFDGSDDWCALYIVGKEAGKVADGRFSYKAPQIVMPKALRMEILRMALHSQVGDLLENLDSYLVSEDPAFATYTETKCLFDCFEKKTEKLPLDTLLEYISDPAPDEFCFYEGSEIENLKRLMTEYMSLDKVEAVTKGSPTPSVNSR